MPYQKIKTLNFADIVILSLIFFSVPIFTSLMLFIQMRHDNIVAPESFSVSEATNYSILILELLSLALAWLYLRWRRFDFRTLNFKVDRYTLPLILLLVLSAGAVADIYQYLHNTVFPEHYPDSDEFVNTTQYTPLLLIVSLLNGSFEELFFMGIVFAVAPKTLPRAVAYSIAVRFLFHTYQGIAGAMTVTTLGAVFFLFRRKISALVPFFLAHAVFDVFGLSAIRFLYFFE